MKSTKHGTATTTVAAHTRLNGTGQAARIAFVISGLAAETVSVTGIVHADVATAALRPIDLATGAVAAASALSNGSYLLKDLSYEAIVFTKSGAADNATISYLIVEGDF